MSDPLARLIGELLRVPGIGPKTATRLAHYLLKAPPAEGAGARRSDRRGEGEALSLLALQRHHRRHTLGNLTLQSEQ